MIKVVVKMQVMHDVYFESDISTHPLAVIATKLRKIAEKEFSVYSPVLREWFPEAGVVASIRLHQFYGERLVGFCLSIVNGLTFSW